ncbi:Uroporphyrinogen decarboxylase [Gracilaria domingensis]|nr:Uroporphyrinogen decarboxylase [Gracilaria domingensis]
MAPGKVAHDDEDLFDFSCVEVAGAVGVVHVEEVAKALFFASFAENGHAGDEFAQTEGLFTGGIEEGHGKFVERGFLRVLLGVANNGTEKTIKLFASKKAAALFVEFVEFALKRRELGHLPALEGGAGAIGEVDQAGAAGVRAGGRGLGGGGGGGDAVGRGGGELGGERGAGASGGGHGGGVERGGGAHPDGGVVGVQQRAGGRIGEADALHADGGVGIFGRHLREAGAREGGELAPARKRGGRGEVERAGGAQAARRRRRGAGGARARALRAGERHGGRSAGGGGGGGGWRWGGRRAWRGRGGGVARAAPRPLIIRRIGACAHARACAQCAHVLRCAARRALSLCQPRCKARARARTRWRAAARNLGARDDAAPLARRLHGGAPSAAAPAMESPRAFVAAPPLRARRRRGGLARAGALVAPPRASALPAPPAAAERATRAAPLLLRAARGERVERPPVWLMRQAGRYMADFRAYSDRLPFRQRSETPAIARELSLQPWRAFGVDAVIFFSDILTPLPAIGQQFDIVRGTGPLITHPLRSREQILRLVDNRFDLGQLQFVRDVLQALSRDVDPRTALLGFVGAPFTLAAYMIEGRSAKNLLNVKRFMYSTTDQSLPLLLERLSQLVADYAAFQIESGAQAIQLFDSWAHHLSPDQYRRFAIPYAKKSILAIKRRFPDTPVIFFANGLAGKVTDVCSQFHGVADVLGVDWSVRLSDVRRQWSGVLQGNVDPAVLAVGDEHAINAAVLDTVTQNGGVQKLIINLGHGVVQQTPESAVATFVDRVKELAVAPLST